MIAHTVLLRHLAQRASEFDIIHCHMDWIHLPLLADVGARVLTTLHGRLDLAGLSGLVCAFPDAQFVSVSDSQRIPLPTAHWAGTVYHGMPPNLLRPCFDPQGYLAFLGRMTPEKGPETAIRLAKRAGMPLRMSAKVPSESNYFRQRIEPLCDGDLVRFVGETKDAEKGMFLGNAAALLFPIEWPEPFGLVMIEAMACGTPVIAYRHGSVPEVIEDGVSGFIVDGEAEAMVALKRIGTLDRRLVRQAFERRFAASRMMQEYMRIYHQLIECSMQQPSAANGSPWPIAAASKIVPDHNPPRGSTAAA
jgi:glycosyltransferase involved in cell wall biosynthesis